MADLTPTSQIGLSIEYIEGRMVRTNAIHISAHLSDEPTAVLEYTRNTLDNAHWIALAPVQRRICEDCIELVVKRGRDASGAPREIGFRRRSGSGSRRYESTEILSICDKGCFHAVLPCFLYL